MGASHPALWSSSVTAEVDIMHLRTEASEAALAMFVDSHNAGYYINAYTIKVNPGMDSVLEKLMAGIRQLHQTWAGEDAARHAAAHTQHQASSSTDRVGARQTNFRRTVLIWSRFETCFRRASWESGSEMLFPVLFGHMSFTTHRCWTVYLRRAIYLAHEAWRQAYGQVETQPAVGAEAVRPTYQLPGDAVQLPPGWREEKRPIAACTSAQTIQSTATSILLLPRSRSTCKDRADPAPTAALGAPPCAHCGAWRMTSKRDTQSTIVMPQKSLAMVSSEPQVPRALRLASWTIGCTEAMIPSWRT